MSVYQHPTAAIAPPAAVMRVLQQFDRSELEGFISIAIGLLDVADGDADEEDATDLEDDFRLSENARLFASAEPGCPISDPSVQCDEDELSTDLGRAFSTAPGCIISDSDHEDNAL
jgi:hypothetical protein